MSGGGIVVSDPAASATQRRQRPSHQPGLMLLLCISVVGLVVVPWARFEDHAHWNEVGWLPFVSPPVRFADIALNALLYLPLGYWLVRYSPGRRPLLRACLAALLLSVATEFTQVYSHRRFASATDVVANTLGAASGAMCALRRLRR